ncbi:MAG TPA: hypothetical protein VHE32_13885 [Rhodanobacteraceae bacterium]|jgi:hypothetical protein|nr:hypothetical protein [Rhodanobacteraceae bacterium]
MKHMLLITILALALAACASKAPDDEAGAKPAAQAAAAPARKTVFDPELEALQKAKDVQKAIDAGEANTRKAIDKAENGKDEDDGGGG